MLFDLMRRVLLLALVAGSLACACSNDSMPAPDAAVGMDASTPSPEDDAGPAACGAGEPLVDPRLLPVCDVCAGARCVPIAFVSEEQRELFTDCEGGECVPDLYVATSGEFLLATCRSVGDVEGRCVSICLPSVAAQEGLLPTEGCADSELCVPCYDPTTGEETGACGQGCDPGPTEPPRIFERCCGGLGACVPGDLVPADQRDQLGPDSCAEPGALCAPDELNDGSRPASCRSLADLEGRCLPLCLPEVAAQGDTLPQSTCAATHRCVPCFDPTTGDPTHSCTVADDMPVEPPVTFDTCCGGIGTCVPPSTVDPDQRDRLGNDTCSDPTYLCAPTEFSDPTFTPATCRSVAGAEGRCLPACLPGVAAQASILPRDTCPATHLCAPCYDPTDGTSTGSCTFNSDTPAEPPLVFPGCCAYGGADRGTCVPSSLVPPADRDSLPTDTCTSGELCVPDPVLADPTYRFPTCTTAMTGPFGGSPGACIPDCMVGFFSGLFVDRSTCAAGDLCAPCTHPLTGASTGACD